MNWRRSLPDANPFQRTNSIFDDYSGDSDSPGWPVGDRDKPALDGRVKTGTRFRVKATGAELFFIAESNSGRVLLMDAENDRLVTCAADALATIGA
jgi:hypothetical protein